MIIWSKEIFSKNLKFYIKKRGITQKELSEVIGVSAPTINDWINGKKYPRIDKIEKLADFFGVLKSDLIEEKTEPEKTPEDNEIITLFSKLPTEKKKLVIDLIRNLLDE